MERKTILNIILGICAIAGTIYYQLPFILGFVVGQLIAFTLILFPSPLGHYILSYVFSDAYTTFKGVQKNDETSKEENNYKVTYKK